MNFWLIQAIGFLGSALVIGSMQFNNRRLILLAQAVACVLWSVHYSYLGAMTAVMINFISFSRSIVFYFNDRAWAKSRLWLWAFVTAFFLNSILTWDGPHSLLPGAAMIINSFGLWSQNTRKTRLSFLINSPLWLSYNIITGSVACAITESIAFVNYIIAIWRFDIRKSKKEETA